MNSTIIVIPLKRKGTEWQGALVLNNVFDEALIGEKLIGLVGRALAAPMNVDYPDGTDIVINVTIKVPDGSKSPVQ